MRSKNNFMLSRRGFSVGTVALSLGLLPRSDNKHSDAAIWPTVQGNAAHTGYCESCQRSVVGGGSIWQVDVGGKLVGSPVVANGAVIVGTRDGRVEAFELVDGTQRWSREGTAEIRNSAAVDNETVYVNLRRGAIHALDIQTGVTYWQTGLRNRVNRKCDPVLAGNTLYVSDALGWIYAIDASSGEILWQVEENIPSSTMAVVEDSLVFYDHSFIGVLDINSGRRNWSEHTRVAAWGPPTVSDDIYASFGPKPVVIAAISKETGDVRWTHEVNHLIYTDVYPSSPIVTDELVIVVDSSGTVIAVSKADGTEQWRYIIDDRPVPWSPPIASRETIYIPTEGNLVALSLSSGDVHWRAHVGETPLSPALVDDVLITATEGGKVMALGAERSLLNRWGTEIGAGLTGLGGYGAYRYLRNRRTADQE